MAKICLRPESATLIKKSVDIIRCQHRKDWLSVMGISLFAKTKAFKGMESKLRVWSKIFTTIKLLITSVLTTSSVMRNNEVTCNKSERPTH